jgi:hypothetical protein
VGSSARVPASAMTMQDKPDAVNAVVAQVHDTIR